MPSVLPLALAFGALGRASAWEDASALVQRSLALEGEPAKPRAGPWNPFFQKPPAQTPMLFGMWTPKPQAAKPPQTPAAQKAPKAKTPAQAQKAPVAAKAPQAQKAPVAAKAPAQEAQVAQPKKAPMAKTPAQAQKAPVAAKAPQAQKAPVAAKAPAQKAQVAQPKKAPMAKTPAQAQKAQVAAPAKKVEVSPEQRLTQGLSHKTDLLMRQQQAQKNEVLETHRDLEDQLQRRKAFLEQQIQENDELLSKFKELRSAPKPPTIQKAGAQQEHKREAASKMLKKGMAVAHMAKALSYFQR